MTKICSYSTKNAWQVDTARAIRANITLTAADLERAH